MKGFRLLFLALISVAVGYWDDGGKDSVHSHLGLYVVNLTCNSDETLCGNCFTSQAIGRHFLHIFKYTKDPPTYKFIIPEGDFDWGYTLVQGDPSELFRLCANINYEVGSDLRNIWRISLCMTNDFSGVALPITCAQPTAMVSLDGHQSDEETRGQQLLFCVA